MKRWLHGSVVAVLIAALALTGCGQSTGGGSTDSGSAGSGGQASAPQCEDDLGCIEVAAGEPIKIGFSLVISGPDASLGEDSKRGIEIALDDRGGKLLDHEIQIVGEDDLCTPEGGQAAANKLAADPQIVGVIGTNCSGAAFPAVPIITQAKKVMVSPSATNPDLTSPTRGPDFAGFLRTAHNDKVQGAVAAEWAIGQGYKTAATIHDGSPYAEGLAKVFAETFKAKGGTITNEEAINRGDTDMKPVLTRISANAPDIIFYPIFVAEAGHITAQKKEVPGLENTVTLTADGAFSPDFIAAAGSAALGHYMLSPDLKALSAGYDEFLKKHEAKYGGKPPSVFHAHAYDATHILLNAIEAVAVKGADGSLLIPQQKLRDQLYATKNYAGLTGNLTCDANGDCADPKIAVYQADEATVGGTWDPGVAPKKIYPQS